jgi:multidrug efflux pump subunit AcrA (membrane-fusion protein)
MTSDNAIPVATTGDVTRIYFDGGSAFGVPHARPSTTASTQRTWDDEQLLDAAYVGSRGRALHPDLLAALCARYIDMVQGAAAMELRLSATVAELVGERTELNRVAALHAEASVQLALVTRQRDQAQYERTLALHQRAGTTPAGIAAALDRAARAVTGMGTAELTAELDRQVRQRPDDRFDRSEPDAADTLVMAVEDLGDEELRAFGMEVDCG